MSGGSRDRGEVSDSDESSTSSYESEVSSSVSPTNSPRKKENTSTSTNGSSSKIPVASPQKPVASSPAFAGANHPALSTPLVDQIKSKWDRPMNQLPIHTDFLRMFPGMSLEEEGEILLPKFRDLNPAERGSKESAMLEYFSLLAERDEEDNLLAAWIKRKFFEYIPDGAAAEGAQTPIHFQRLIRDVIPETSSIAGILKCVNQAVAAPAVMVLKLKSLPQKVMYKDCRGIWDCNVAYRNGRIIVTHVKWEESMPKGFEFAWALDIELGRDGKTILASSLSIHTIKWILKVPDADKERIRTTFKDFINSKTKEVEEVYM